MDFLAKLDLLMQKNGYSKNSFSKACGIPYTTINNWYTRGFTGLQLDTVKKISAFFGTALEFWADDSIRDPDHGKFNGVTLSREEFELIQKYRELDTHGHELIQTVLSCEHKRISQPQPAPLTLLEPQERIIRLDRYYDPVSAGTGECSMDGYNESFSVVENATTRRADYVVTVRGDSMEPRFHDGDLLLVMEAQYADNGDICVFHMDGKSYVKQQGDGVLISLNKRYAPIPVTEDIVTQGRVIGVLDPEWIR